MTHSTKNLVKQFYVAQEKRILTYNEFERAFEDLLTGPPKDEQHFLAYRQKTHDATLSFQEVNHMILKVIGQLKLTPGLTQVVTLMEKVMNLEEKKLQLTAALQVAAEKCHAQTSKDGEEELGEAQAKCKEIVQELVEVMDELKYEVEDILMQDEDDNME